MIRTITLALLAAFQLGMYANQQSAIETFMGSLEPNRVFATKAEMEGHYKASLQKMIAEVEERVCKKYSMSRQELQTKYAEMEKKYSQTAASTKEEQEEEARDEAYFLQRYGCKPVDKRLGKITRDVLKEFGVNPDRYKIFDALYGHGGLAGVMIDHYIFVNSRLLKNFSDHEVRAIMAHEVQHIIFRDNITQSAIAGLPYPDDQLDQLVQECQRICELRADLYAALKSPYYAATTEHLWQRWQYCEKWTERFGMKAEDHTHPDTQARTKLAHVIGKQLAAIPGNKATDPRMDSLRKSSNEYNLTWFAKRIVPFGVSLVPDMVQVARQQLVSLWNRAKCRKK